MFGEHSIESGKIFRTHTREMAQLSVTARASSRVGLMDIIASGLSRPQMVMGQALNESLRVTQEKHSILLITI